MPPGTGWSGNTLLAFAVYDGLSKADSDLAKGLRGVADSLRFFGRNYRLAKGRFGGMFARWLRDDPNPYGSYGNGSAV